MFDYTGGWLGFEFESEGDKWRVVKIEQGSMSLYPHVCECVEPGVLSWHVIGDRITVPTTELRIAWMDQARTENTARRARMNTMLQEIDNANQSGFPTPYDAIQSIVNRYRNEEA